MKQVFLTLFLFLLILPVQAFGQSEWTTVLDEKFSNNNFGWTEGTESDYVFKVKAGRYTLENKSSGTMYRSMNQIELDYQKDYIIQADLRFVKGDDNRGFGIYFGGDSDQYLFFSITANGYYSFMKFTSQWTDMISWTESDMIAQQASTNNVKIEKIGSTISFYINDELVNTYAAQSTFGKYLGFAINANMTWEADNVKIMERESSTNVTTGDNKAWGFYDNFETNNNYWFETSEGGVSAKVSNGNYIINNNARSGETVYALMDVPRQYIKEYKDGYFVGTAKVKVMHSGNAQAGIALGDPDHVMYVFGITKGGKYFCNKVERGAVSSLISPTNSAAIKQGVNALSMWVYNSTITLMINESSVTEAMPVSPLVSYLFGLSVAKGAHIEVDDLGSLLGDPNAEDIVFGDGSENPINNDNNDNKVTSKDPYADGLEVFRTGEYEKAIPYFTQALAADPDHYDALYYRAISYGAISESQKALDDIQTLLDKKSDYEGALLARGVFYIDLDRLTEAYADFDQIINYDPAGRANAYYYRGFAKVKEGKTTSACKDLRRAKELQTTFDVDSMLAKHCK